MSSMLALVDQQQQPKSKDKVTTRCGKCKVTRSVVYAELIRTAQKQSKYTNICMCRKCLTALPEYKAVMSKASAAGLLNRSDEEKQKHYSNIKAAIAALPEEDRLERDRKHKELCNSKEWKDKVSQSIKAKFSDQAYQEKIKNARKEYWENDEYRTARTWNKERFVEEARKIHGNKYNYDLTEYRSIKIKVAIKCNEHGVFYQIPGHHIHYANGCPSCAGAQSSSGPEHDIAKMLLDVGEEVVTNDRLTLGGVELDIFLPKHSLAIEYHGLYWHSYATQESGPQRYRHHFKCTLADRHKIRLLQFYEDEWRDNRKIVESMIICRLGKSEKLHARKCSIIRLNNAQSRLFFDTNHLQGNRGALYIVGLVYDNQVVSALSLSRHKEGGYEVIRFATKIGHVVVGGLSKLLTHAKRELSIDRLFTYVDRRYGNAASYLSVGFTMLGVTPPGYKYVKNGLTFYRTQFQKHKLQSVLKVYDPALTEAENMFANGYRRIWDAGHFRLEWKNEN